MQITPIHVQCSLVLVGRFNPAIVQPFWLATHKLIGEGEAESAKVEVIFGEVSQFTIEERLSVGVTTERFSITSLSPQPEPARDLFISIFANLLPHTPVRALGINLGVHFDCKSFEIRDKVGRAFAPPEPWGEWGAAMRNEKNADLKYRGGMVSLSMRQNSRTDGLRGHIQARMEPSSKNPLSGIFVEVNDHYQLAGKADYELAFSGEQPGTEVVSGNTASQLVEEKWEASLRASRSIVDQVMSVARKFEADK